MYIDIETRSREPLKQVGVYRYVVCPDFRILMNGWGVDGGPVRVDWTGGQDEILDWFWTEWNRNSVFVAHNADFERVCFSAALRMDPGKYLDPERWEDPAARAAEHGLPRKLEHLGKALGGEEKDTAGTRLINLFCKPVSAGKRKGLWNGPETHPDQWLEFLAYCRQDVVVLQEADQKLPPWPPGELELFNVHRRINDRGMDIDLELAERARDAAEQNQSEERARVTAISGIENPGSVVQVRKWLESRGYPLPNLQAKTVEKFLERDDIPADVREVMELRQELALVASKKFSSALASQVEGRLRGSLKFFGAHTGRWSGSGTQPHNLPRLAFDNEVDETLSILHLKDGGRLGAEDLKRCVRPMFTGPLTVFDFTAIEAIVIAWLAGEQWVIDAVRAGRDIYVETANRMGGLSRSQGKVAVLALGYQGGVKSIRAMDFKGEFLHLTDDQVRTMYVLPWRKANPATVRLWGLLHNAFGNGGSAGPRLRITHSRNSLGVTAHLHLPSGRAISYHGARHERYSYVDEETEKRKWSEGFRYADPAMPFHESKRIPTYGGRLGENATQGAARDLLGVALVALYRAGYDVVAHVHDEVLVAGEHDPAELLRVVVKALPAWARGIPLKGDGKIVSRYRKV